MDLRLFGVFVGADGILGAETRNADWGEVTSLRATVQLIYASQPAAQRKRSAISGAPEGRGAGQVMRAKASI